MLILTDAAAIAISRLAAQHGLAATTGLRICSIPADANGRALAAAFTNGPGPHDQVLELRRARVFLEPQAAEHLADKVLDAKSAENGQIAFRVRRRTTI